ncbi:MAG: hypothetical protein FWE10_08700 [Rikenellaceae bacterium]|nr:hypothetical protein [Rikenellaceae bacterium]MCL2691952.1 hypothetical protein [Rikenellaceae bacterium]
MRNILIIFLAAVALAGCDKQRDLYGISSPLLEIEGDWRFSLGIAEMRDATAMLYKDDGTSGKWLFREPNVVRPKVSRGEYDVLVFNGLMFSEQETNLDAVFFRNTDKAETFEAVAMPGTPNSRLVRSEGEYIASNDMEVFTSADGMISVEGERVFYIIYRNGERVSTNGGDHVEDELYLTPLARSYWCQIIVHLTNPSNALSAAGSFRGFAGSAFAFSGLPSHFDVTHQLRLNDLQITKAGTRGDPDDEEEGTVRTPWFVTFGPPLDVPARRYTFDLTVWLRDGQTMSKEFEVSREEIERIIERITEYRNGEMTTPPVIVLEFCMELPENLSGGSISVDDWGDDELITVPIRRP